MLNIPAFPEEIHGEVYLNRNEWNYEILDVANNFLMLGDLRSVEWKVQLIWFSYSETVAIATVVREVGPGQP